MNAPFDLKKLYKYIIMFAIGVILVLNGLVSISIEALSSKRMSDADVIKRAKELGLVDLKEEYLKTNSNGGDNVDNKTKSDVDGR